MSRLTQAIATSATYPLCPAVFAKMEQTLQDVTGDRRYKLNVRAGTNTSAIVMFRGHKFLIAKIGATWSVELLQS